MAAAHSFRIFSSEEPRVWDDENFRVLVNTDTVGCLKVLLRYTIVPKPRESMMRLSFGNIVLYNTKRLYEYSIRDGSELNLVLLPPTDSLRSHASRSRSPKRSWRVREFLMRLDRCREV